MIEAILKGFLDHEYDIHITSGYGVIVTITRLETDDMGNIGSKSEVYQGDNIEAALTAAYKDNFNTSEATCHCVRNRATNQREDA